MSTAAIQAGPAAIRRRRTGLPTVSTAALAVAVALFLAVGAGLAFGRVRTVTMLTGSMRPGIPAGSFVVLDRYPAARVAPGDVITFEAPIAGRPVLTHRVVDVRRDSRGLLLRTKGDANASVDPWTAVVTDREVWRVRAVIPRLGSAVRLLGGPVVRYGVPALLLGWLLASVPVGRGARRG